MGGREESDGEKNGRKEKREKNVSKGIER